MRNRGLTKCFQLGAVLLSDLRLLAFPHLVHDAVMEGLNHLDVPARMNHKLTYFAKIVSWATSGVLTAR